MARDGSTPLRTFVGRTLALRLCAVTLVAALAVLAFTYLRQREMFELQVTDVVRIELALLMHRASQISLGRGMTVAESLPFALDERREVSNQRASGHFVYLRIFSPALARPLEATDADYPLLSAARRALQSSPPHAPVEQVRSEMRNVDRMPYVHVLAPIRDLAGQGAGQAELVFAVSSEAIGAARVAVLKAIAIAVGIVLATTALLYPVILRLVRRLADLSESLLEANLSALALLGAAIAIRDSDTDAHNYRVTIYSLRLGEAIGLPPREMQALLKGAFLHDVGKIGIGDDILLKPARLTEDEFAIMRTHVDHGIELVRRSSWLADSVAVVGAHHEKFDGSGYPSGIRGSDIPIVARIFAIVDVFDALTSQRPYKVSLSFDQSVALLEQERDRHFDGVLLDAFLKIAPALHQRYAGRNDHGIKRELEAMARSHFSAGLDTLAY